MDMCSPVPLEYASINRRQDNSATATVYLQQLQLIVVQREITHHSLVESSAHGRHSPTRAGIVGGPCPHIQAVPSSSAA